MPETDITPRVMKRVIKLEKRRSFAWLSGFGAVLGGLIFVVVALGLYAVGDIVDRGVLEQLQLLGEDREIIARYWQDTTATILVQLPRGKILVVLIATVVALVFLWLTRKKLGIVSKRIKQVWR